MPMSAPMLTMLMGSCLQLMGCSAISLLQPTGVQQEGAQLIQLEVIALMPERRNVAIDGGGSMIVTNSHLEIIKQVLDDSKYTVGPPSTIVTVIVTNSSNLPVLIPHEQLVWHFEQSFLMTDPNGDQWDIVQAVRPYRVEMNLREKKHYSMLMALERVRLELTIPNSRLWNVTKEEWYSYHDFATHYIFSDDTVLDVVSLLDGEGGAVIQVKLVGEGDCGIFSTNAAY